MDSTKSPDYEALHEGLLTVHESIQSRCIALGYEGVMDALDSLEIRILKERSAATVTNPEKYLNRAVGIVQDALQEPTKPARKTGHLSLVSVTANTNNENVEPAE